MIGSVQRFWVQGWPSAIVVTQGLGQSVGHVAQSTVVALRHWGAEHARRTRRMCLALLVPIMLCTTAITWTWQTTPAPAALRAQVAAEVTAQHGTYVTYDHISFLVVEALIAAEDEHFYEHHGVDVVGTARALWDDLRAGQWLEGGSTLTQQLAKNAYLHGDDRHPLAKWQDMILALKIENHYSKAQIVEMYLNLVYFGDGAYGIGAASQHYFGIPPAKLDLAQAALLAGLVQAPTAYDPRCAPTAARARQDAVLTRMVADGLISPSQARSAANEALPFWAKGYGVPNDSFCAA